MEPKKRNYLGAFRICTGDNSKKKVSTYQRGWQSNFKWKKRALAYDAHMQTIEQRATEKTIEDEYSTASRRRVEARNLLWQAGKASLIRAESALEKADELRHVSGLLRAGRELLVTACDLNREELVYSLPDDLKQIALEYGIELSEVQETFDMVANRVLEVRRGGKPN